MGGLPRRCRRGGRQRYPAGGLPGWSPAYPAFSLLSCPLSPHPPSPVGKGETQSLFRRGASPPAPLHLTACGTYRTCQAGTRSGALPLARRGCGGVPIPCEGAPSASPVRRKTDRTAILLAVPAAKERGDRGRGTSAFEMVLSPGAGTASAARVQPPPGTTAAGIASAAGGKPPAGHHSGGSSQCRRGQAPPPGARMAKTVSAANGLMQGCRGRSPRRAPQRRG